MCCAIAALLLVGPRAALFVWYLINPLRFNLALGSFLLACLGFLFLPWTTLAYLVAWQPNGGVQGFGVFIVVLGVLADLGAYGGGWGNRRRMRRLIS